MDMETQVRTIEPIGRSMTWRRAMKRCLWEKYARFQGRASRAEYWKFDITIKLFMRIFLPYQVADSLIKHESYFGLTVYFAIWLLCMIPALAVGVRRFHDIELSGWWWLPIYAPIFIYEIIAGNMPLSEGFGLVVGIWMFGAFLASAYLCCKPSQQGTNRYGEQPPETIKVSR